MEKRLVTPVTGTIQRIVVLNQKSAALCKKKQTGVQVEKWGDCISLFVLMTIVMNF
jgi:hypothetical protein